jgi:hypothetical protein
MAAPIAASASTVQQAAGSSAQHGMTVLSVPGAAKVHPEFSNQWVNCTNGSFGTSGGQQYFEIACSLVDGTSWSASVLCSNGIKYGTGPFTSFEDVRVYCPAGYAAEEGFVSWTT